MKKCGIMQKVLCLFFVLCILAGGLLPTGAALYSASEIRTNLGVGMTDAEYSSLIDYIESSINNGLDTIPVYNAGYRIPKENADWLFYLTRLEEHPEITRLNYSYTNDGYVYQLLLERWDEYTVEELAGEMLDGIKGNNSLTDVQKAVLLHDRIAAFAHYDSTLESEYNDSANGIFLNQTAVCSGYASAYELLMNQAGIDTGLVSSIDLKHIWNVVNIDGERYHVDVTWDDPVFAGNCELPGYIQHNNLLRSSTGIAATGHTPGDYNTEPSGTAYDDAFWQQSITSFVLLNGKVYYMRNYVGNQDGLNTYLEGAIFEWTAEGSVSVIPRISWKGSSLAAIYTGENTYNLYTYNMLSTDGQYLYFTNGRVIYKYDPVTKKSATSVYTLPGSPLDKNVIYGFKYEDGAFVFKVGQDAASAAQAETQYVCYSSHHYVNNICTRCGQNVALSGKTTVTVSHSCTVENDLSLNYYFTLGKKGADSTAFTDIHLEVTKASYNSDGRRVYTTEVIYPTTDTSKGYTRYKFTFKKIAASELGNSISAVLHATQGGVEYRSGTDTYNIKKYAYTMIGLSTSSDSLKTMLVDLLNYGAASQTWFGYNTESLANAELTDEQKLLGTVNAVDLSDLTLPEGTVLANETATISSKSVILGNNIEIKYYMTFPDGTDLSGVSLVLTYTSLIDGNKTVTVKGSDFVADGSRYYAKLSSVRATDLGQPVTAVIKQGTTVISSSTVYSVEYYAKRMMDTADANPGNETYQRLKPLLTDMVKFIRSAKSFFESK